MARRSLVIVNPAARHGVTGRLLPTITGLLDGQLEHEMALTEGPGHGIELAAAAEGFEMVVAVGGDGTVHEVLNGLMQIPRDRRPVLGLLPTGSGNDYRRTLGISKSLSTAVLQLIGGRCAVMDLGVINGIYFANSVAIGLDARVTAKAAELKATTGWSGILLYLRSLLIVLFTQYHTHSVTLTLDGGRPEKRDLLLVAATNGRTYGGGFKITPDAVADDGLLDTCIISKIGMLDALWRFPFVIFGAHGWMRAVTLERHRSVVIDSTLPIEGQIDGEVTIASRYEIAIEPAAIDVIVPDRW